MSTVNISLPAKQVGIIDKLVNSYGFANRSEFFRSLLRLITHKPDLVEKAATFPFVVPQEKSTKKIVAAFKKSKKYSPAFLKDLEEGLKSSRYFQT
jgi:metal-responsive CopG/Arc/MetJ family transcriptional regulator